MTKRSASSTPWLFVGVTVGVLVIGGVLFYLWKQLSGQADYEDAASHLNADLLKAKEVGTPLVAADLAPMPPISDAKNAAVFYRKATSAIQTVPSDSLKLQIAAETGDLTTATSELAPAQRAMQFARDGASIPDCDFKRNWDLGPDLLFPDLAEAKKLCKFLAADAETQAASGNHDAALKDLDAALGISRDAGSDPDLISVLVGFACQRIMERGAERCIDSAKDVAILKKYETFFDAGPPKVDIVRMLKGESYSTTALIRNLDKFGLNVSNADQLFSSNTNVRQVDPDTLRQSGIPPNLKQQALLARQLEMWNQVFAEQKNVRSPVQLFGIAEGLSQVDHGPHKPSYTLVQLMAPVYSDMPNAFYQNDAAWQVTRALVKARIYFVQNGKYPLSLKEIGFNETDPFNGKPYGYIADARSVRIYSVGRDHIDNKGMRETEVFGTGGYDIAASDPPVAAMRLAIPPAPPVKPWWHPKPKPKSKPSAGTANVK